MVRTYNLCDAVLTQRLAPLGLRPAEHEVLANLLRGPGSTQQSLAERCFVAKSGMSMLLTRLQARGLIERRPSPQDARAKALHLTPEGQQLAESALAIQREVLDAMTAPFSLEELAQIDAAMRRAGTLLEGMLSKAGVAN